jgi:hypothetical protein
MSSRCGLSRLAAIHEIRERDTLMNHLRTAWHVVCALIVIGLVILSTDTASVLRF